MKTKNKLYFFSILALACSFTALADVFTTLGLSEKAARTALLSNIVGQVTPEPLSVSSTEDFSGASDAYVQIRKDLKEFKIPFIKNLNMLTAEAKKQAAAELCIYVKNYVNSPEFLEEYAARRAAAKPVEEPYRPSEAQIKEMKKSLIESEKQLNAMKKTSMMTAAQQAATSQALDEMRRQITQYDDPTPNNTLWKKNFPEDPAIAVKNRLQEYLALSATVDFDAKTTGTGKKQKFTNPEYEKKGLKWKAIYRAGREANATTTEFVKKWLQEPIINKDNIRPLPLSNDAAAPSSTPTSQAVSPPQKPEKKSFLEKVKEKAAKAVNDF